MTRPAYETEVTQYDDELNPFIEIVRSEKCRSFLEIGSRYGGSLWRIAAGLQDGAKVVSIDSGGGMGGNKPGAQGSLRACVARLNERGYDAHLLVGDSYNDSNIVKRGKALGPFDAVFIDGDHSMEGMVHDWHNFGRHAKKVCGFHDVVWKQPVPYSGKLVDCKAVWDVLKYRYRSQTFAHPGGNMGVGVLWTQERHR